MEGITADTNGKITVPFTVTIPQEAYYQFIKDQVMLEAIRNILNANMKYDSDTMNALRIILGTEFTDE